LRADRGAHILGVSFVGGSSGVDEIREKHGDDLPFFTDDRLDGRATLRAVPDLPGKVRTAGRTYVHSSRIGRPMFLF